MNESGAFVATVSVAAAAAVAVTAALAQKCGMECGMTPPRPLTRPGKVSGLHSSLVGWAQTFKRYDSELSATKEQQELLQKGVIDARNFHSSQF